jgi:hypothetical protein
MKYRFRHAAILLVAALVSADCGYAAINSVQVTVDPARSPIANFLNGDNLDFISSATAANSPPGCFTNNVLNAGQSCNIAVTFMTGDPRANDPDEDFGLWNLVERVSLTDTTDPLNRVDLLPTVSVTVRDPAKAPEPASFCLTAAGTALMLLHMFRRKHRQSGDRTP